MYRYLFQHYIKVTTIILVLFSNHGAFSQHARQEKTILIKAGDGWARNSVNAVIVRHNSLATYKNTQYIAYYNDSQALVIGKRRLGTADWQLKTTQYKGDATDAHRSISIITDGDGYLHVSWDHHGNQLRYCKTVTPGSLELTEKLPMTGKQENNVTYPEFYNLPGGDLLFLYRDGSSGNGNLMLNRYDTRLKKWVQVQSGWVNGEGERNPYWQMATDRFGTIHLSWVWRESPNVESNHDICYARSKDGGRTWEKSTGEKYTLPITAASAEYAAIIPQKSELINSTAIAADHKGRPYTVTYFRSKGSAVPQYHLVFHDGKQWVTQQISNRKTPFTLSGGGTKRIPMSRPQIILKSDNNNTVKAVVIYRDEEQGNKVTATICKDIMKGNWEVTNLNDSDLGLWEPTYDTSLWQDKSTLNLYVQKVEQGDGEKMKDIVAQPVYVLEWKPDWK